MECTFLKSLTLRNFRVYEDFHIQFKKNIIIFTGNNGVGKTSILESLNIMNILKSFRETSDTEIIKWNENFYSIKTLYSIGNKNHKDSVVFSVQDARKKKKKC